MTQEFGVGDRVKRITGDFHGMKVGDTDTIIAIQGEFYTTIVLEQFGLGHSPDSLIIINNYSKNKLLIDLKNKR